MTTRRALVLASEGKVFCAGADFVTGLGEGLNLEQGLKIFYQHAMTLFDFEKLMIAAVQVPQLALDLAIWWLIFESALLRPHLARTLHDQYPPGIWYVGDAPTTDWCKRGGMVVLYGSSD